MYARLFLVLPLGLTLACGVGGDDDAIDAGSPDTSARCLEADLHNDLAWLQTEVFTPTCSAFTSCHRGVAAQAAMLNMEDGNTQVNLVDRVTRSEGVADSECLLITTQTDCDGVEYCAWDDGLTACHSSLIIVVPGDSANSYLMVLIDHESKGGRLSGPLPMAGTMPFNNPLMCEQKRDAVARWIDTL